MREIESDERRHGGNGVGDARDVVARHVEFAAGAESDQRPHVDHVVARQARHAQPLELAELARQKLDRVVRRVQKLQSL